MEERKQRDRGTRKLTAEQVERVRILHRKGYSFGRIAEMFNVHRTTIFNYISGKRKEYQDDEL